MKKDRYIKTADFVGMQTREAQKDIIKALAAADPAEKRRRKNKLKKRLALIKHLHRRSKGYETAARITAGEYETTAGGNSKNE